MNRKNYEVIVLVNGKSVKEYIHNGNTYIEGRKGTDFSLKIKNNSARRILAVTSIDGISVLTGDKASYNSNGYIVPAYSSIIIDGWRVSDNEVKKFFFTSADKSYAVRNEEDGNNVGVVGVAIFREKITPIVIRLKEPYPYIAPNPWIYFNTSSVSVDMNYPSDAGTALLGDSNNPNCSVICSTSVDKNYSLSNEIGTGWGDNKESSVVSVVFDKEDNMDEEFIMFYNSHRQLQKIGVDFTKRPQYITPCAFPAKYCKPPKKD